MTANDLAYWLALLCSGQLKRQVAKDVLYRWCVRANRPLETLFESSAAELARELEIAEQQANHLLAAGREALAWNETLRLQAQKGVHLMTRCDPAYPEALAQRLPEKSLPYYFFYRGHLALLSEPAIAVLGAAQPSEAGRELAVNLGCQLAEQGYQLLGGYDKGVDRLALDAARAARGPVIILLPLGFDGFEVPLQALAPAVEAGNLLVLSPYPPAQSYQPVLGKARLGLITAWSEALFVIEPEVDPQDWPDLDALLASGGRVFLWENGDPARRLAWLEAGALPFDTLETAQALLHEMLGVEPAMLDEEGDIDNLPGVEPIVFEDADAVIDALGNYGRVPPEMARRLREQGRSYDPEID